MQHLIKLIPLVLLLFGVRKIDAQNIKPLPDENFWGASYAHELHFVSKRPSTFFMTLKPEQAHEFLTNGLRTAYQGQTFLNGLRFLKVDTNLVTLLPSLLKSGERVCTSIHMDYYDGECMSYKKLLITLYNAEICQTREGQLKLFSEAKQIFSTIPANNISKVLGCIQLSQAEFSRFGLRTDSIDYNILHVVKRVDSITFGKKYSDNELAWLNECLGDFYREADYYDSCFIAYERALNYANRINEERLKTPIQQRIVEKMLDIYEISEDDIRHGLEPIITAHLKWIDSMIMPKVTEFYFRDALLIKHYNEIVNPCLPNAQEISFYSCYVLDNVDTTLYFRSDILKMISYLEDILIANRYFRESKEVWIVYINLLIKSGSYRVRNLSPILGRLSYLNLNSGDIKNAGLVNSYMLQYARQHSDVGALYDYWQCLGDYYYHTGKDDSLIRVCNNLINIYAENRTRSGIFNAMSGFRLLRQLSLRNNDSRTVFSCDSALSALDNDLKGVNIVSKIEANRISVQRDANDVSLYERIAGYSKWLERAIIIVILLSGVIVILYYRGKNKAILYEKETIKSAFFSHTIARGMSGILNRIHYGIEDQDFIMLAQAETMMKVTGKLFKEMGSDLEVSTLHEQIRICSEFLQLSSQTYNNIIKHEILIGENQLQTIRFPSKVLIHAYVNAVEHGKLGYADKAYVKAMLTPLDYNTYELTISNNGETFHLENTSRINKHGFGGLKLIEIGCQLFNSKNLNCQIFFNRKRDVYNFKEESGDCVVLKIKIVCNV